MSTASTEHRIGYFPALDGLRGLAVTIVMFFHGGVAEISGGFLSVDIFFVLSGFLITSLLLAEFERNDRLDLRTFWTRRARRLLPALFVVLVVVAVYSAFLAGESAAGVRGDTIATLLYSSNWWFIFSQNSYFDQFADPSPLTHTWSLAIEEQWYLLLPLVLVVLLPKLRSRRVLGIGFAALALVSAGLMLVLFRAGADGSRIYYGTDTRVQALLVGAALACLLTPGALSKFSAKATWWALVGVAGLVALMVFPDERSGWLYQGGFLLFALVCALILASVLAAPDGLVARGLSWGPLVWIGKISYGLYLWHWPVYVVLTPDKVGFSGVGLLVLRFAVTYALAIASFYLIEMPVRRGALRQWSTAKKVAIAACAPVAVLGLVGAEAATAEPPAPDSLEAIQASATRAPLPAASRTADPGQAGPPGTGSAAASPAPVDGDVRAILVGDSIALSLYAAYRPGDVSGLMVLPGTEFGCGVVPFAAALNGEQMPVSDLCRDWDTGKRSRLIAESGANLGVLFAGSWEQYDRWLDGPVPYTDPRWEQQTAADYATVLKDLAAATPRVAVVLNACHGAPDLDLPDAALYQAGRYPGVVNDPARVEAVNRAMLRAIRESGVDATVIDPNPVLCPSGYQARLDGVELHSDGVHFTDPGADKYWQWLGPQLRKAARGGSGEESS